MTAGDCCEWCRLIFTECVFVVVIQAKRARVSFFSDFLVRCFSLNRLMFWTNSEYGKIERATLSGTQRVTIVTSNLYWPFSIDLDRRNKLVFWVDAWFTRGESIDYDGSNRKILFQRQGHNFYGVTFFSSYLFVSNSDNGRVYKFNATNANGAAVSSIQISQQFGVDGLVAYDSSRQSPGIHWRFKSFSSDQFLKIYKYVLSPCFSIVYMAIK